MMPGHPAGNGRRHPSSLPRGVDLNEIRARREGNEHAAKVQAFNASVNALLEWLRAPIEAGETQTVTVKVESLDATLELTRRIAEET